jgi:hypothetical protein
MTRRRHFLVTIVTTAIIIAVLLGGCVAILDHPSPIDSYRVVGPRTIELDAGTGPSLWARVVSLEESPTHVVIAVRSVGRPGVGTVMQTSKLVVQLASDLDERAVIDAFGGSPVVDCTNAPGASAPSFCEHQGATP